MLSTRSTASTSRSTSTASTKRTSRRSCPCPGGIRLDEAVETFRRLAARKTVLGAGFTGLVPDERNLEPRRAARLGARPLRSTRGRYPYRRLDRAQGSHAEPGRRSQASEHVPLVWIALPRRRARQAPRRLPAVRPPLPALGARAHRLPRRPGHLLRGGDGAALGRPARLLRSAPVHRTARRGRAEDRPGRRDPDRPCGDRGRAVPALGDGLRLHGRLDGERGRREVRPRVRGGRRAPRPARVGDRVGRRAHAGGDPLADADAEDRVRRRGPARRALRTDQRLHPSDDRRGARELREPGRRDRRRARRADLVHRPAGRPGDDQGEAAGRLRPRRVEPAVRACRRHRPAPRAPAPRRPAAPALRQCR